MSNLYFCYSYNGGNNKRNSQTLCACVEDKGVSEWAIRFCYIEFLCISAFGTYGVWTKFSMYAVSDNIIVCVYSVIIILNKVGTLLYVQGKMISMVVNTLCLIGYLLK